MGKHTAKSGVAQTRSRGRAGQDGTRPRKAKRMAKAYKRLEDRKKYFKEVLSKSPRSSRYKKPGSLKGRTN